MFVSVSTCSILFNTRILRVLSLFCRGPKVTIKIRIMSHLTKQALNRKELYNMSQEIADNCRQENARYFDI